VRADRPSLTASLVAALRAFYTALPEPYNLASDPVAAELCPAVLALPARGAALWPGGAPILHRAVGALSFGLSYHVALRTRAIDDALRDAVGLGADQLVILGAGLDSRAQRLDALAGADVYEVDHPSTQRYKAERLAQAGVSNAPARKVTRVAVDFERDRLDAALLAAGLDPSRRSFWIWEGVTMYLTPDAVAGTLSAVSTLACPGSRIAVTYTQPGRRRAPRLLDPAARLLGDLVGEPIRGMMSTPAMFQALAVAGFRRVSDESDADWAARFWPSLRPADEWERLAVAERAATLP
jgi:methyltransferase (TIGR00027 family)